MLCADGSAIAFPIKKGEIITMDGPLFSKDHPWWKNDEGEYIAPDIRFPVPLK